MNQNYKKLTKKELQEIEQALLFHPNNFQKKYPNTQWILKYKHDGGVVKYTRQYKEPLKLIRCVQNLELHHEIEIYQKTEMII